MARPVLLCKLRQAVLFSHGLPSNMLATCLSACLPGANACCGRKLQEELLVTASSTTVKSWTADQLKLEAQGDGLMFSRSSRTLSASSSSAPAGAAAGAGSAGRSAGAQLLQERLSGNSGPSGTDTDLSHENMGSGDSGAGVPSSAAAGPGSGAGQHQQQRLGRIVSSTPAVLATGGAAAAAAAAGGAAAAGRLPAAGRIPASAAKPNPFSRRAVEARLPGMVVGPNNRVVPAALSKLDPNQAFGVLQQVAPVLNMLQTPQVRFACSSAGLGAAAEGC